jgi:hypothetical protein
MPATSAPDGSPKKYPGAYRDPMQRLLCLEPKFPAEAESQAAEICALMEKAAADHVDHIVFGAVEIHPMVLNVLTSKGYIVRDVTHIGPNGLQTLGWSSTKKYLIK